MKTTLTPAAQSPVLRAFGEELHLHLTSEQTDGRFALFTELTPPGGGPPPHCHDNEDECFFVLEGTVSFLADGRWVDAKPGDTVLAPRRQVHTFRNNTDRTTRMLIQATPGGFERFFAEAAAEFARPGGPDMGRAVEIAKAHGIHFAPA
jgi:quercetin dioxygenase-like cupin family protein